MCCTLRWLLQLPEPKENWNKMLKNCVVVCRQRKNWIDPPEKWEKILGREKGEEKYSILGSLKKAQFCSECHDVQPTPLAHHLPANHNNGVLGPHTPIPTHPPLPPGKSLGRRSAFKWQEIWKKLKFKSLIYWNRFISRPFYVFHFSHTHC